MFKKYKKEQASQTVLDIKLLLEKEQETKKNMSVSFQDDEDERQYL